MIKKILYLFVINLLLSIVSVSAQNDANAKEALKVIWLAYQSWQSKSAGYIKPADYLIDPVTNFITGQNFYSYTNNSKYEGIDLSWKEGNNTSAELRSNMGKLPVSITWTDNRITGVKIDFLYNLDYVVNYDAKGEVSGFTGKKLINNKIKTEFHLEYSEGKLSKVTLYENEISAKSPWIRSITTYTYNPDDVVLNALVYRTGKSNTPGNIASSHENSYKKIDDNTFRVTNKLGQTTEIVYNNKDTILSKKITKKTYVEEHTYKYLAGKLFREDILRTNDGMFDEKESVISFSLTDQPDSVPDCEKTQGRYKFNKDGELIFEQVKGKYRYKVNGVWDDWKFVEY